jgi:long-chain acyl-CoA synthetase
MNIARMLGENLQKFGVYDQLIYVGPDGTRRLTNLDIEKRAAALADRLRQMGIGAGDIVAVCVGNIVQIPELINGVMGAGAAFLPVIYALTPPEIRYILNDSRADLIITEKQFLPKIEEALADKEWKGDLVVIDGTEKPGITPYAEMLNTPVENGDAEDLGEDDLAILMYTSGTTGMPKGVMLSHGNLMASMRGGAEVWPYGHSDRTLITVPMNHIYGVLFFHESCAFGSSIVLMPWFDAAKVLDLIKKYTVTVAPLVPTMITMMMENYDPSRHNLKSIKYLISAGAPLAEETWKRARELFGVELYHGYGLTEASPNVARQLPGRPFNYGSVGPPIPGLSVKIIDDAGQEVPRGNEGEIICKGPGVMLGYLNKPDETAATLKDGWLHTGDLGRFDEDGELYVTGRKKDLIIKGGENIDPGISENWLYRHPAVLEAAVIAIPDPKYGEEVAAAVTLKQDQRVTEDELLEHVRAHVHHFFAPKKIFILDELPKTSTGKILKREIRKQVHQ